LAQTGRAAGHKIRSANAGTMKSWCQKEGPSAELFNDARRSAQGNPDSSQILTGM
jgi:hypothetical protein